MIVHYEIPSFVFGGQNCIHCNPGMTEPEKPPIPSISDWTSPILLRPLSSISLHWAAYTRSGPEHKNRKKHIGHGARFNDYTGRKHSVGILCPPALSVRSGVQCRTQLDCEGAGALRGFSGGAVAWRPSPPGTNGTTRASRAVPISNSPISKGLLPDLVCGEEGVKVCQDDMCTDLKGHLLEFWGS